MEFYGTLGDACWERETLEALFRAGMTGARLNLSHTTLEACAPLLEERFWPAARQAGVEAKLIVDLQGPELRVGTLKEPVSLAEGAEVLLGAGGIPVPAAALAAARCRTAGRSFFVVTQLLWSMEQRAVPTRAEVCDIYNAVLDGSDALMLTGETAAGRYPVQAMEYLVKTARSALSTGRAG